MLFYDPIRNLFFDDALHGTRTIFVPDPEQGAETDNVPQIEVANPACNIPATAMEVSVDVWQAAINAQYDGRPFIAGEDGMPTWPPTAMHSYVGGRWVEDPKRIADAAKSAINADIAAGMAESARQIAVLQDSVELGMSTQAEADAYTAWRRYRVLLSRLQADPAYPDVTFPVQPEKVVP